MTTGLVLVPHSLHLLQYNTSKKESNTEIIPMYDDSSHLNTLLRDLIQPVLLFLSIQRHISDLPL